MTAAFTQLVESTFITATFTTTGVVKPSIRQICLVALTKSADCPILSRELKREANDLVVKHWPETAAAKKFAKHYAWYKGIFQKEGKISRFNYPTDGAVIKQEIEVMDSFQSDLGATPLSEVKEQLMTDEQVTDLSAQDRCSSCGLGYNDCSCDY